jgi:predicted nucleotidyltransferase
VSNIAAFDPERLMRVLHQHNVRFVLIGALAARLHGFTRLTADADIAPADDRANLDRLAAALKELKARVYTESVAEGLPFNISATTLARSRMWNLITDAGRLDIAFAPAGTKGYEDLKKDAEQFEAFGVSFFAASLDDIIRSKAAAGREKDQDDVLLLRALKRKLEK